jgi:hypothetical protein
MLGKSKSLKDDTGMIVADGHLEEDRELIALEQYMGDAGWRLGWGWRRKDGKARELLGEILTTMKWHNLGVLGMFFLQARHGGA